MNAITYSEISTILTDFNSFYDGMIKIVDNKLVRGDNLDLADEKYSKWLTDLGL